MALFEVIRRTKDSEDIVVKYSKTNFNTGSQLIVQESQEALFFAEGKALDLFRAGKYTLSTNNIPLIRNILNIPTGFRTPFTCEVYFIDISEKQSKWGTPSKIEFLEPKYNFPIQIGACGEIRFKVVDSRKLILKLVGIKKDFSSTNINEFFQSQILVKAKTYMSNIIKNEKISIFEIDSYLEKMSNEVKEKLDSDFEEYGIELLNFFITTIAKPEEDRQYQKFKDLYYKQGVGIATVEIDKQVEILKASQEAEKKIIDSEAQAKKRQQEGYTYQEEKQFEIGKEVARNDAIGQYANVGIGLGMMTGISSPLGEKVSQQVTGAFAEVDSKNIVCPNCKTENDRNNKFCKNCGKLLNNKKVCLNCRKELTGDMLFCPYCGKEVK